MVLLVLILKLIFKLRFPVRISFADTTRRRYGHDVLELFRTLERTTIKLFKAKADLDFLETCRDTDLVPRFLQFKLANRRLTSSSEALRSRRRLLDVEIRSINKRFITHTYIIYMQYYVRSIMYIKNIYFYICRC